MVSNPDQHSDLALGVGNVNADKYVVAVVSHSVVA
ncbi:hypothetical protein predicted by Glimmer/Critica [Lactiplantibacillus plantarum]|nr:hypothetical protein predicted by Glimmer/Critica [Lactiplantibacillus plantarum]